jgi:hypothetical protein
MRQTGGGILQGHGPSQTESLLDGDVGRHPHPADRRTAGDVVDGDDCLEGERRAPDLDEL